MELVGSKSNDSLNSEPKILFTISAIVLLGFLLFQCAYSARMMGQTTDEAFFTASGYPMLRYNNYTFLSEQPPLANQIGAIPLAFLKLNFPIKDPWIVPGTDRVDISRNGRRFLYKMGNDPDLILRLERSPIILLTLLLGLGIWLLGSQLWGRWGGLLSLALFAFCPNIIAHGSLYTTDMSLTAFYFFAIFALKRFFEEPSDRRILWVGLACGAAFMSKISSLILLPVISSLFLIYYFTQLTGSKPALIKAPATNFEKWILGLALFLVANALGERQAMVLFGPFLVFAVYLCARDLEKIRNSKVFGIGLKMVALIGAVLCIVYSIRLKKRYGVSVAAFLAVANLVALGGAVLLTRLSSEDARMRVLKYFLAVWVFAALVIVLGYTDFFYKCYRFIGFGNYMAPLGIVLSHSKGGHAAYVEGSFITCNWRFFPGVMAVKTPVLTLLLSGLGALMLLPSRRPVLIKALVLVPLVFFLGAAMANKINIGLRHVLPIYPFIFLLGGLPAAAIANMKPGLLKTCLAVVLFVLLTLSAGRTLRSGPDYIAYFNEFTGTAEQGAKLVADSNINWGQDNKRLSEFVLEKKIPHVTIGSEASNTDIYEYYKIPWKQLDEKDLIHPAPGFYALSVGYYARVNKDSGLGTRDSNVSWFKGKQPSARVGKTFYIFEVPLDQTTDPRP